MNAPTGGVGVDAHVRVTYLAAGGFAEVSYGNGWLFASGVGAGLSIPQIGTDLFFVAGHHWYRELSTISEVHEESYLFSPGRQCTGVDGLSGGRNFLGGQLAVSIPTAARDSSYGLLFFYRRDLGEQTTISRDDTIHCVETSLLSSKKWDAPAHIEATFGGWVAGIGLRGAFTAGF